MIWQKIGTAKRSNGDEWAVYKAPGKKPYFKARPVGSVPTCGEGGYFDLTAMLQFMELENFKAEKAPE